MHLPQITATKKHNELYEQLQNGIEQVANKGILIVQGDWNAKVGEDVITILSGFFGTSCDPTTNNRGLSLHEFTHSNDLILANTLGEHNPSRKWAWHPPSCEQHNKIDYIMIRKRFRASVNFPQTRTFPATDIGSDRDLVMMIFRLRLKIAQQQILKRIEYNLEGLNSPNLIQQFNAVLGRKFHQLIDITDRDVDVDTLTNTFKTATEVQRKITPFDL